ncbi:MAG: acyclic terpene utilization AtuA family protein [Acidobacteriota bacterium]
MRETKPVASEGPRVVRIANAGGYWGDDPYALRRQVLGELSLDYISIDFLAEITMSILQKQYSRDPKMGYARDFVQQIDPLLGEIIERKIKIITNAGGVNPVACAEALLTAARARGLELKVAVIGGDNIAPRLPELLEKGVDLKNMETGEDLTPYRDGVLSANAYFGALPVVKALESGPDIVLSGRVTDTGITLAALMHEFGWPENDYHRLAHGIVGGHLIECGAQATGGNFTDWSKVPSFLDVGFPILEFQADGSFVLTKHPGTGGLITCQTTREQLLYEMGDPQLYITPDVIADFTTMKLEPDGLDRVKISGVRGRKPTDLLKVSVALEDGYKSSGSLIISGPDAREKAEVFARVFWSRLSTELERGGLSPLEATHTEFIGDDSTHGRLTPSHRTTEILLRVGARDHQREKLMVFRKLLPSLILSGPAGVAVTGGAPAISEVVRYWPALIPQEQALPSVALYVQGAGGGVPERVWESEDLAWPKTGGSAEVRGEPEDPHPHSLITGWAAARKAEVPLMRIAHARSGDKGDTANIGLIGRSPACYVWLRENVHAEQVKEWLGNLCLGEVRRYLVPNLWALNFLLSESLGGGGTVSLQIDAQGKTYGQALLRCPVEVPEPLLETILPENAACPGELIGL